MAKVEGLNLREGRWHVRIVIPDDLKATYKKARVNPALGTAERREATLLATIKRAEWLAEFEAKRSALTPALVPAISPELGRLLAERVRATVLAGDDNHRSDLPLLAEMARMRRGLDWTTSSPLHIPQWIPPEPREDDLSGMTPDEAEEFARLNAYFDGKAAIALAGGNLASVLALAQTEAGQVGVKFTPNTPGAREALKLCLKAYRTAHREVTLRDSGEVIDTPIVLVTEPLALKVYTLRDVYGRWKLSGESPRSADSIAACGRALVLFEGFAPKTTLKTITKDQGDTFRTWLRDNSATMKTARDRLNWLKSLLKYAADTLEWIPKHPWMGLKIEASGSSPRKPWKDAELKTLFTAPLHASYTLPKAWNAGGPAAYWIPLIGLYTGARLGELCQLRPCDIQASEDIPIFVLTSEGENQSIKSAAGHRSVPIHSELIRLGFLDYVESVVKSGAESLWPALRLRKDKPSGFFSRWFSDHRKAVGITERYPDFHCFRHTVRPLMRRAGFNESTMDLITGHATGGSVGTKVYDHWTLVELRQAIESIQYPALTLPIVSPGITPARTGL